VHLRDQVGWHLPEALLRAWALRFDLATTSLPRLLPAATRQTTMAWHDQLGRVCQAGLVAL